MLPREPPRQLVLLARNVLKLVDLDVFELLLPFFEEVGVGVEQVQHELNEVGKIEVKVFALAFEVLEDDKVHRAGIARLRQIGRGNLALGIRQKRHIVALRFVYFDGVEAFAEGEIAQSQPVFVVDALQNRLLILLVQHHKVGRVGEGRNVLLQNFVAGAVEGQNPPAVLVGQVGADAPLHLPRRLVGKGDGKDMLGRHAERLGDVHIARRQNLRLSAPRARRHAHIPLRFLHGGKLLRVQFAEQSCKLHYTLRFSNICSLLFYYTATEAKKQGERGNLRKNSCGERQERKRATNKYPPAKPEDIYYWFCCNIGVDLVLKIG